VPQATVVKLNERFITEQARETVKTLDSSELEE
jgi:hypothetical protein